MCIFLFSKGKKTLKFVWERQTFIAQCLSMGSQTSVDAWYGYIQSYDPQLPCLLYAVDQTSSTRLLWWSNKIMIGKRNISKSRITNTSHDVYNFQKKKRCGGWELGPWPTRGLMFESRLHWPRDWMNCTSPATVPSSVKWNNNSPDLRRFQ